VGVSDWLARSVAGIHRRARVFHRQITPRDLVFHYDRRYRSAFRQYCLDVLEEGFFVLPRSLLCAAINPSGFRGKLTPAPAHFLPLPWW
jgi:hypothetical protein